MRTPLDSPFSPGSDAVPEVWAGRALHLADWERVLRPRRLSGLAERGRTLLGEAGTGKSALVRRIADQARAQGDWVTPQLRIPTGTDPVKRVAAALLDLADQAGLASGREARLHALLERVQAVAASGVSLTLRQAAGPEPYTVLTDLLVEIGRCALRRGDVMVLVHLDEVQNIADDDIRSQLLVALGDALAHEEEVEVPGGLRLRRTLPLAVYLTGLPEFADLAGARTGATFARRFQTSVLEAIDDDALELALRPFIIDGWPTAGDHQPTRIRMEQEAAREIVRLSCGEPFLFQLAGEGSWFAGSGDVITLDDVHRGWSQRSREAEAHVSRVLDRLPARERELLEAMAALAPEDRTLTHIAHTLGYERAAEVGTSARRLDVTRGIISRGTRYRFRHRAVEAYLTSSWPSL